MAFKRMKFKIKPQAVILATILIGAKLGLATPVLIDDFTTTQIDATLSSNSNAHSAIGPGTAGILGGYRVLDDFCVAGCDALTHSNFLARGAGHNDIVLNNDDFNSASGLVTYSGSVNGPKTTSPGIWDGSIMTSTPTTYGLGGVDLSGAGTNTQIRVLAHTDLTVQVIATFYDGAGTGFARAMWTLAGTVGQTNTELTAHFFDSLGTTNFIYSGTANSAMWTTVGRITAITFQIDGSASPSSDTNISYFAGDNGPGGGAPEPASFGMLAGGMGGLIWFARKNTERKN